ncbi:MAG: bifunctional riboflavin kinase/FAD synthetase [Methylobacteriaceae bacterium]|nr:bifunctional riboflavin kinase/FAD synthetase [Methylobacteriaceae bacterium]
MRRRRQGRARRRGGRHGAGPGAEAGVIQSPPKPGFVALRDPAVLPPAVARPVVAIGNFDGVHRGHRGLIARAVALAGRLGRPAAALTFEPHPSDHFARKSVIFRLTPAAAKALALSRLGLDAAITLGFDAALAGLPAQDFVDEILVRRLAVSGVVVGDDFHFGKARAGTPAFLVEAGARAGFAVEIVARIAADEDGSLEAVSSTAIRKALEAGDVRRAAHLLGHPWTVVGEVAHGRPRGRTLGFPTANLALDPSTRLRHGIYAVRAEIDGTRRNGVASFGSRPTVDDGPPLLEVFLFDFSGDLYGRRMAVEFVDFLRDEVKFDGLDPLVAQMKRDADDARAILAGD